jgi:signal peptidase II
MQKHTLYNLKWNVIFFLVALLSIFLDQWSKSWLQTHLVPGQSIPETGFFRLTYAQNTGAAFSVFYGRTAILTYVSIAGSILILVYNFILERNFPTLQTRWNKVALGLILGGTVGNLIDRLSLHYVRDFIDVSVWPIFNLADSSIVVGVGIFAVSVLLTMRKSDTPKQD